MTDTDPGMRASLREGLISGLLAGLVLVVLFFFYDLGQGTPLRTPSFLWGAMWQDGAIEPRVGAVIAYTILHFLTWAALGIFASIVIWWAGIHRNILIGAAYGLFACSLVFYLGLIRAPDELILSAPAWPVVVFGNTIAGIVMFAYLRWSNGEPGLFGIFHFLRTHPVTRRGLVAGLIGATVLAVWFLIMDALLRDAFFTPAALAGILFSGASGPADVEIGLVPVVGYTFVHYAFFALVGVLLSGLVEQVQRFPPLVLGVGILFVVLEVFIIALSAMLGVWILSELAWWSVVVGNLLAAAAMGLYFWRAQPKLHENLTDESIWAT